MPDIVRANVRYCLNVVRSLCCCLDIVLSARTRGKVNSCNDIQYANVRHCQNASRHILMPSHTSHVFLERTFGFRMCSGIVEAQ